MGLLDREWDEMSSLISLESHWDCVGVGVVAPLIEREAFGGGGIWGFLQVVRVLEYSNKWMLSWVYVLSVYTHGLTPWSMRCQ